MSSRAFSTFRILPRSGRIAWKRRSRPCLARAAGRVALDDEDLGEGGVLLLAVGELARERAPNRARPCAGRARAPCARPRAPAPTRRSSRRSCLRDARVLLEVRAELLVDDLLHPRLDLGGDELVLGLRGELRVLDLDRDDRGQALAAVVAGEASSPSGALVRPLAVGVLLDGARQRRLEALEVRAAVAVVDRVGEGEERLGVALVPLERDLDPLLVGVALGVARAALDVLEEDDLVVDRLLRLVQVLDEGLDPALVGEVVLLLGALVDGSRSRTPGFRNDSSRSRCERLSKWNSVTEKISGSGQKVIFVPGLASRCRRP